MKYDRPSSNDTEMKFEWQICDTFHEIRFSEFSENFSNKSSLLIVDSAFKWGLYINYVKS